MDNNPAVCKHDSFACLIYQSLEICLHCSFWDFTQSFIWLLEFIVIIIMHMPRLELSCLREAPPCATVLSSLPCRQQTNIHRLEVWLDCPEQCCPWSARQTRPVLCWHTPPVLCWPTCECAHMSVSLMSVLLSRDVHRDVVSGFPHVFFMVGCCPSSAWPQCWNTGHKMRCEEYIWNSIVQMYPDVFIDSGSSTRFLCRILLLLLL